MDDSDQETAGREQGLVLSLRSACSLTAAVCCLAAVLSLSILLPEPVLAAQTQTETDDDSKPQLSEAELIAYKCAKARHWRDAAYLKAPMSRYEPYKNCIAWTAHQFDLPEELLYAVLYVERGDVNGKCSRNKNGTLDCGPAQINQVRMAELKRFDLTMEDMRQKPCHNIWAMGYLLRREIEDAGGQIWQGVGNYHYHYSAGRQIHERYVQLVRKAWERLNTVVAETCGVTSAK